MCIPLRGNDRSHDNYDADAILLTIPSVARNQLELPVKTGQDQVSV